ncbi:MAG TPA: DUF3592 domain-containing protein [Thermoanaerobaculia bacterium]|nr:DUF3592 domain-containing protein [Thermoanaerobaculia bacterium]
MLLAAALALAGIAAIVSSTAAQRNASRANDWDQKRGTVERVEGANVAYRYEAGGATQRGSAPARPRVTYTAGRPVLVYVNPANPAESLLELPPLPPTWPLAAGSVLLLVAAVLAFFALQEGRKTVAAAKPAPSKVGGDTTERRRAAAPPMSRLKPPPPPAWKRGEGEDGEE